MPSFIGSIPVSLFFLFLCSLSVYLFFFSFFSSFSFGFCSLFSSLLFPFAPYTLSWCALRSWYTHHFDLRYHCGHGFYCAPWILIMHPSTQLLYIQTIRVSTRLVGTRRAFEGRLWHWVLSLGAVQPVQACTHNQSSHCNLHEVNEEPVQARLSRFWIMLVLYLL